MNILEQKHRRNSKKEKEKIMLKTNFKSVKKLFIRGAVIAAMLTTTASAAWVPGLRVKLISTHINGDILVLFDKKPEGVCNSWGFEFVITGNKGDLYKALRSAQVLNEKVQITYDPTTTPGAEKNDCKLAKIYTVITEGK